ncbi:hypothetical protein HZF02_07675 [Pseudomonas yamanorum]|nr:hypothetical protein HZF02_07675 [Pseudomonas yamanorum]
MLNSGVVSLPVGAIPIFTRLSIDSATGPSNNPLLASNPAIGGARSPDASTQTSPSVRSKAGLKTALGDRQNWRVLGQKLNEVATKLGVNATPQAVQAALKSTPMDVHPDSSCSMQAGNTATLETFIKVYGLYVPSSHFHLTSLADSVNERALAHPFGDFGGGLSWPVPLSISEQHGLLAAAIHYANHNPSKPPLGPSVGVLEYLNTNQLLSGDALRDPVKALEMIVSSDRGQAIGQAVQKKLNGIATDTSVNEYALAAISLALDPQSIVAPRRNKVAGFDLAQDQLWGKPASVVLNGLSEHLSTSGKASPEMAKVGAYLLLARQAPQFLIKDLPASVTFGSPAWVSLSIAAATIESQSPGTVPNMTFAQVMLKAESAALVDPAATQLAQKAALLDWGLVNGIVSGREDDSYSPAEVESVRGAFNQQLKERIAAAGLLETEMPSRKEIALAKLKERFGENVPFEERLLRVNDTQQPFAQPLYDPNRAPAGLHSMLDIAMSGLGQYKWKTIDQRIVDATKGKSLKFDVNKVFNDQFTQAIDSRKKGISTTVKHLVAQLPLTDRQNLEYGKLEFFKNNTYTLGLDFTSRTLEHKNDNLLVKATGVNGEVIYEIDLKKGVIKTVPADVLTRQKERNANLIYPIEKITPTNVRAFDLNQQQPTSTSVIPVSFSSARTQAIADTFIEHLDIDNKDVVKQAKGVTPYDQQMENEWKTAEFFLNLVPLRSAIVNFQNGHYLDGAVDLGMDVFGFVTAGLGAVAKVAKVGSAANTAVKVLKVAKIIGTTAVGAFNPASGLGELAQGGVKLIRKGGRGVLDKGLEGVNKLRGVTGRYDLLKMASQQYDAAATGTFKVAGQSVEGGAVLHNGKWYAFDAGKMQPYGSPLESFTAKTQAVGGTLTTIRIEPGSELSNRLFSDFKVPESRVNGLSRNSQGVYVGADGHLSHIRHTDSAGQTAVYEVRQVTRTEDGVVQARIYHNNRQTQVLVQHVRGDQWQRLGIRGGDPLSVVSDLGPVIGGGGEGVVYASLDGKSVYKDLGPTSLKPPAGYMDMETQSLNKYYGDGFAKTIIEDGRKYIKMGRIDGVDLSKVEKGSLPPEMRSLLDDVLAEMEMKDVYHNDLQLKNFMYSSRDKKIYPVDMESLSAEFMVPVVMNSYKRHKEDLRLAFSGLIAKTP